MKIQQKQNCCCNYFSDIIPFNKKFITKNHALSEKHEITSQIQNDNNKTFTVDDALDEIGIGKFQHLLTIYLSMGWLADAMEMLLLSFLSPCVN